MNHEIKTLAATRLHEQFAHIGLEVVGNPIVHEEHRTVYVEAQFNVNIQAEALFIMLGRVDVLWEQWKALAEDPFLQRKRAVELFEDMDVLIGYSLGEFFEVAHPVVEVAITTALNLSEEGFDDAFKDWKVKFVGRTVDYNTDQAYLRVLRQFMKMDRFLSNLEDSGDINACTEVDTELFTGMSELLPDALVVYPGSTVKAKNIGRHKTTQNTWDWQRSLEKEVNDLFDELFGDEKKIDEPFGGLEGHLFDEDN